MQDNNSGKVVLFLTALVAGVIIFLLTFVPFYNVWAKSLAGKATLKEAEYTRQIAVKEAQAKKDSAAELALAEIERAKGVAEANKIIGESLRDNDEYLTYLWLQTLQDGNNDIIYIPTEANLPLLEAGRGISK